MIYSELPSSEETQLAKVFNPDWGMELGAD